jgi:hypothetical protein
VAWPLSLPQPQWLLSIITSGLTLWLVAGLAAVAWADDAAQPTGDQAASQQFYQERIEPVLREACLDCHSHAAGTASGQLMLDSRIGLVTGGARGAAIVPGQPEASLLMRALSYADNDLQMPPDGKLPDSVIADIRQWIAGGAQGMPEGSHADLPADLRLTADRAHTHWSYRPPQTAQLPDQTTLLDRLPEAQREPWRAHLDATQDPIDWLVREKLMAAALEPSAAAARSVLARRAYYDLTGLPPSAEALEEFEGDPRPTDMAFASLVDRLLASPRFGERWARHWMDIARYADTKGYVFQEDREYPQAYKYRDWLIASFNANLPYDQFVKAQLAGDLIDPENVGGHLPALGFLTLGRRFLNNKHDIIDDRLDVMTRGLMGMTLACARCHDHKYDPVDQADYYALYGVFLNTDEPGGDPWPHRLADAKEERQAHILIRGSPGNRGAQVPRRFVTFLKPDSEPYQSGSGRELLANQIVDRDNPLTARVFVNRVWMRLMGASLVESPSDLGARCGVPVQQDVLDLLAVDFMDGGWDMKALIRRLMLTATYQQASVARPDAVARDVENALYWRMNRRRMDFEALRDAVLAAAGQLDNRIGGPSEKLHAPPFSMRRSVYAYIDRQNLPGVFRNFDVASPDAHSPQRLQTTVPQQGLYLMNSQFVTDMAQRLGDAVEQELGAARPASAPEASATEASAAESATAGQELLVQATRELFRRTLRREPEPEELQWSVEFLQREVAGQRPTSPQRWLCGYGHVDVEQGRVLSFTRLPHYTGKTWQGGPALPDPQLSWLMLNRDGGHPGGDLQHAVIRRFVAPQAGKLSIRGRLNHPSDQGDGVRGTLISDRQGKLGQWTARKADVRIELLDLPVVAGEQLDFVTDCLGTLDHDGFQWKARIRYSDGGADHDSARDFPAPVQSPLSVWAQFAQGLMQANEFAFVD